MQNYRSLVRFFKREFPELRLQVWRTDLGDDWGDCNIRGGRFRILLSKDLSEAATIAFLIHELGHALSWHLDEDPTDHGPLFGVGYAKAWRKYLEWLGPENCN